MGFFDFLKKRTVSQQPKADIVKDVEPLEKLTEDGELPWGWFYHNKAFIEQINGEYSYFLDNWINTRKKSPRERYSALKSFVMYLHDVERLCKSKGECFELWFYETVASKDYIEKREKELEALASALKKD